MITTENNMPTKRQSDADDMKIDICYNNHRRNMGLFKRPFFIDLKGASK